MGWVPKFMRKHRERIDALSADTTARAAHAARVRRESAERIAKSAAVVRRSDELARANNIAAILAGSLGINDDGSVNH